MAKIILFDIETLPIQRLAWTLWDQGGGVDHIISDTSIITICYKELGKDEVHSIDLSIDPEMFKSNPNNDEAVVKAFAEVVKDADMLIAHNGDKFDIKRLRTAMIQNGVDPILVPTFDTLKAAKKYFSFTSNRLDYIAHKLNVGRKGENKFSWWREILTKSDDKALEQMVKYCKQDVLVLESVLLKLLPWLPKQNALVQLLAKEEENTCPHCASNDLQKWGFYRTGLRKYQKHKCNSCGYVYRDSTAVTE